MKAGEVLLPVAFAGARPRTRPRQTQKPQTEQAWEHIQAILPDFLPIPHTTYEPMPQMQKVQPTGSKDHSKQTRIQQMTPSPIAGMAMCIKR